jgi:serine/threonine protein kinase
VKHLVVTMQGKYPEGLKAVEDDELRDFIQMCIVHTPEMRPDTRKLLKHSFFEGCRGKNGERDKSFADVTSDALSKELTNAGAPRADLLGAGMLIGRPCLPPMSATHYMCSLTTA